MGASTGARGLVILDRDGVINRDSAAFVKNVDEFQPLPGSVEAIAALHGAGYTVTVASNQSGLARGLFDRKALRAMHRRLRGLVSAAGGRIDRIVVCPHGPENADTRSHRQRPQNRGQSSGRVARDRGLR